MKQDRLGGVGLAQAFAQDRGHFIIPRYGDEGDEAALFQIAQDDRDRAGLAAGVMPAISGANRVYKESEHGA